MYIILSLDKYIGYSDTRILVSIASNNFCFKLFIILFYWQH